MYKAGVIGCRGIGIAHATGIVSSDRARLAAACDLDEETLREFEQRWPDENLTLYRDHREMPRPRSAGHRHGRHLGSPPRRLSRGCGQRRGQGHLLRKAAGHQPRRRRPHDRCLRRQQHHPVGRSHPTLHAPVAARQRKKSSIKASSAPVQYVIGTLSGPRAMLFRNGTHTLDAICYYAGEQPQWVVAELEEGYENYAEYRGDGGHVPATEPGANGYIHFAGGVRGFYIGGSKTTPAPKQQLEVVGTTGRLIMVSDGGTLYRGEEPEPLAPPTWPVEGIPAGIHELIAAMDQGVESVSPGRAGHTVVELISGFLESQKQGNVPVPIPVPR